MMSDCGRLSELFFLFLFQKDLNTSKKKSFLNNVFIKEKNSTTVFFPEFLFVFVFG